MKKLRVGVVLSGSGVSDGSEIHEAVITLLALDRSGAEAVCVAPNIDQSVVMNHLTEQPTSERRNVLVESARIARGKIRDISEVTARDFDALILPGGVGAAKNLCDFAEKGADCTVDPGVAALLVDMYSAKKPIGAICIAPAVVAKVLGAHHPKLTIGTDQGTARKLEACGAHHEEKSVSAVTVDRAHKIVTTPAYMLARSISEAATGIELLVREVLALAAHS